MLEYPKSPRDYNVTGNGERECLKTSRDNTMDNQQLSPCDESLGNVQRLEVVL